VQGGTGNNTRLNIIGLQLTVPIYQGGLTSSRVREAISNEERARQDFESARRAAEFAARQAYLGSTNGMAQVRALEAALTSTESQLASTRLGQEVGVRTQVDVLNAQQQLFGARRELAQSRYTYILSLLRLEAAIGDLTEDDLARVGGWLGPAIAASAPPPPPPPPTVTRPEIPFAAAQRMVAEADRGAPIRLRLDRTLPHPSR
jgi:outer membrane protein